MKYCRYCGSQIEDEAVVCVNCGRMLNEQPVPEQNNASNLNILCLLGFIFSFIGGIVGLILSIMGYNQVKYTADTTSKNLAKAGMIISGISLGITVLATFIVVLTFGMIITVG